MVLYDDVFGSHPVASRESRALQRVQWVEETSVELEDGLLHSVTEVIEHVFSEQKKPYEESRLALQAAAGQLEKDGSDWRELKRRLQALEF